MPMIAVFFSITVFLGWMFSKADEVRTPANQIAEAQAIAQNMQLHRRSVQAYASTHPTATGSVNDVQLSQPTWFVHMSKVKNSVANGTAYVYVENPSAIVVTEVLKASAHSLLSGVKRGNLMMNSHGGISAVTVPSTIPDGAVVYVGTN